MMSSEEEPDGFALYGDKLLKKAKRSRQRVDAGEPRNSYSSIPNFSSRPSFLSSGLYNAFLSQNQHLGLLGQGFAPAKMLNELLGRQVKQAADASSPPDNMMTMDPAASEGAVNFDCGSVIRRGLEDGSPPPGDVAHHMLRDILQGRKKDFLALEQEVLRGVGAAGADPHSPDNNNSINNNNNNNNKNEVKSNAIVNGGDVTHLDANVPDVKPLVNGVRDLDTNSGSEEGVVGDEAFSDDGGTSKSRVVDDDLNLHSGNASESEQSVVSPASDSVMKLIKEEPDELGKDQQKAEPNELKRARVENIVSSMRSSPSLPTQVNGCKKRKWYHPQQHDTTADRYSGAVGLNMTMFIDDDTGDNNSVDNNEIRQKKVEKDQLKNQLRTMQEQLAEMQQKYVQLCTRMDQDSECQNEDEGSDIDQDNDNNSVSLPEDKPVKSSPPTPVKESPPTTTQQQVLQEQHPLGIHHTHPHHHHPQLPHHALSNAAAMYLGASHKLFMEQEARMNKEAAIAAEQQQQHQQHLQQQSQQLHAHQQIAIPPAPTGQQQVGAPQAGQAPTAPSQHSQTNTQTVQTNRMSPSQQVKSATESFERLNLMRNNSLISVNCPDLEGLADILKTEITSSLGNLIDTIMARFVQQKRFSHKQVENEQMNKDLLLQSQLADRKSPRTKVIDRGSNVNDRSSVPNGLGGGPTTPIPATRINGSVFTNMSLPPHHTTNNNSNNNSVANNGANNNNNNPENNLNAINLPHVRQTTNNSIFQPPKPPTNMGSASANLYSSMTGSVPFCMSESREGAPEQNEALSLVVHPQKKKRHKVTDTRITPRTVSRILAQDGGMNVSQNNSMEPSPKYGVPLPNSGSSESPPPPRPAYHAPPPPPMLPVSLPTSVAIPNPSLHESKVFSPILPFITTCRARVRPE